MSQRHYSLLLSFLLPGLLPGLDGNLTPEPLRAAVVMSEAPYRYGGLVVAHFREETTQRASGSIIGRHLVLTAAHVLYHETRKEWAQAVEFFPRFHKETTDGREDAFAEGYEVWPAYAQYVEEGDYTASTQLDVAILYDLQLESETFPPLNVLYEHESINLHTDRSKLVTGYPAFDPWSDRSPVLEENDLTMHSFGPGSFWIRTPVFAWPKTALGRRYWNFISDTIPGISRNSGGPLHVLEDDEIWSCAAMLTRGTTTESTYRAVAEDMLELVDSARTEAKDSFMMPVLDLTASASDEGVRLQWSDTGETEDGYEIWTQATLGRDSPNYTRWKLEGRVQADEQSFLHVGAESGARHHYKVRPFQDAKSFPSMNLGPFSPVAAVDRPGQHPGLGNALGETALPWKSGGTVSAQVVEENTGDEAVVLFAGLDHLGVSWVETQLLGPGALEFELGTSSERNYDCLELMVDGSPIRRWSGETAKHLATIEIGEGQHRIRWQFRKDKDFTKYLDRASLHSVSWTPSGPPSHLPGAYRPGGTGMEPWLFAHWMGWHYMPFFPWVFHQDLGWFYACQDENGGLYFFLSTNDEGWIYTTPSIFPIVYSFGRSEWIRLSGS